MRKIIICSIPMNEKVNPVVYTSDDRSLPASDRPVIFPVNAFLEKTVKASDELKIVLIAKKDDNGFHNRNIAFFKDEFESISAQAGVQTEYSVIYSDFSQDKKVHEKLIMELADELETGAHVIADITYGPKDIPVVLFTALNFAEKFLGCSIDNIVYGQAKFINGEPTNTRICDMIPLFCLGTVTNTIRSAEPEKARDMLKTLLSF